LATWTTADLLTSIKNRAMFPDASAGSLSSSALLGYASEELLITLVPMILGCREKYYETYFDTVITPSVVSIPIPARAIGGVLSSVQYLYAMDIRQMNPIDPASITTTQTTAYPTNYYFENNKIVLYPTPATSQGTVRVRYFQRPSRLELVANCAQVTSFDPVLFTVTCASVPSTWTTSNAVDFIPQTASQSTPYAIDQTPTNISTNVLTFTSLPADLAVGDWIALAEYTPIPEVPFEFQTVLAQAAAVKGLEAIKDTQGLESAAKKLEAYQAAAVRMITPRDQEGQKKVVSAWRKF
jgi:hypothetical protein